MRLATFNILHGLSPEDGRVDVDRFADAVRLLDADVLALQEVDRHQERSARTDLTAVAAEVMQAPEHRFVAALSGTPGATWRPATGTEPADAAGYGIALLLTIMLSGFIVICMFIAEPILHAITIPSILIGNLLAMATMGVFFWRRHPKLKALP